MSLQFGKVVYPDIAAGTHFRVDAAHQTKRADEGGLADLDVLHSQCPAGLARRLVQSLVTDTLLDLMGIPPVWKGHGKWLREYGTAAFLVAAEEVAHVQYQQCATAKQLRTLYLAQPMAVDGCRAPSATWAHGTPPCCMGFQRNKGFITRHTIKRYAPGMTFFFHERFYLANHLREAGFLCIFAPCRWALFYVFFHIQRYKKIRTSTTFFTS